MYVCMYVCICVCMYVCMSGCLSVCLSVCMYVCMYVCVYKFIYIYIQYTHIIYIYTYTYTYTHTYTCTVCERLNFSMVGQCRSRNVFIHIFSMTAWRLVDAPPLPPPKDQNAGCSTCRIQNQRLALAPDRYCVMAA